MYYKNATLLLILCLPPILSESAFHFKNYATSQAENKTINYRNQTSGKMVVKIGTSRFTATLYDNPAAKTFKSLLPLIVTMIELNENEKYNDLRSNLPTNDHKPGTIQTGDLMIYGSSTLVLFYKTFRTSYSYTKLGRIDDVTKLGEAVGSGNVTVTFE